MVIEEKHSCLEQSDGKQKKFKKTKAKTTKDPCIVCNGELYIDDEYTQRVGLIGEMDDVYGWMCPYCKSEFDMEGKITNLSGHSNIAGEA